MCPPKHVWLAMIWSCIKPWPQAGELHKPSQAILAAVKAGWCQLTGSLTKLQLSRYFRSHSTLPLPRLFIEASVDFCGSQSTVSPSCVTILSPSVHTAVMALALRHQKLTQLSELGPEVAAVTTNEYWTPVRWWQGPEQWWHDREKREHNWMSVLGLEVMWLGIKSI